MKKLAAFVLVACALPSWAQNHQPYPIGERATGLGGAYTALAEDEAGAFYNPAGPAFTDGNSLSVSTSFYGMAFGRLENGLGGGNDFSYSTLNLLPTNASSLWHFGQRRDGRAPPLVLAFSVFAPSTNSIDTRNDVRDGAINFFYQNNEKNLHIGPTVAYRFGEKLALGASVFGLIQSDSVRFDYTAVVPSETEGRNNFAQLTISREQFNIGMLGAVGARYQPHENLSFGLAIRSPSVQFRGKGSQYTRFVYSNVAQADANAQTATETVGTAKILPLRITAGAAYTRKKDITLALDLAFYAPVTYVAYRSDVDPSTNVTQRFKPVLNVAAGVEKYLTPSVPVRVGFFTDLSAVNEPVVAGEDSDDQVQRVGATLTVGLESEHASTTVGVVGTYARVKALGLDIGNSFQPLLAQGTQYGVFFVLSSSYSY